ncbi:MAG: DNA-3-methyladenine glycosylase 2 family protein [Gemmatimonadota bacterium]|jgi:DNA-3-methyladenine glycosylase II
MDLLTLWTGGRRKLREDTEFGPWVSHIGPIKVPRSHEEPFFYLARAIVFQQLAGAAARTIHGRFVEALKGDVTPAKVLRVRESTLRKAGLSAAKTAAVRDLASKVRSGEVVVDDLEDQSNDEIVRRLTLVKGIGPWTAQMFLMFRLHRPDVWPVLDLGVRSGFAKIHGLDDTPAPKDLEPLGEGYRPWRSAAAFYCWRALENELPRPV